ncbi:MAG: hypothetical protein ABID38_00940 [Candidatus Diapherotrites archaeon]
MANAVARGAKNGKAKNRLILLPFSADRNKDDKTQNEKFQTALKKYRVLPKNKGEFPKEITVVDIFIGDYSRRWKTVPSSHILANKLKELTGAKVEVSRLFYGKNQISMPHTFEWFTHRRGDARTVGRKPEGDELISRYSKELGSMVKKSVTAESANYGLSVILKLLEEEARYKYPSVNLNRDLLESHLPKD